MGWNLKSHILDHAATVVNNLPDDFDLKHKNNIHFTFSVDISQLITNHNCTNQQDIDSKMNAFLNDLKEYSYTFEESKGAGKKRKKTLDFSNILMAYHNSASDAINSQNYTVQPHFHLLIPGQLKNKDGKSTHTGKGYMHLRKMISDIAQKHNLTFNIDENTRVEKDKFLKDGATSLTWFLKRSSDAYFSKKVQDKSILKAISSFEKNYENTGNLQYYLKGMRDLHERLKRLDLDLFNQDGVNIKNEYVIPLLDAQYQEIKILQSGDTEAIRELLKNRDNKIARALLEYSYGFDNIVIDELQSRGLYLEKLDAEIVKDLYVHIEQKVSKKDKYTKTLNFHIKQDVNEVLKYAKNEKHFKELMLQLGYADIKMRAKTINGVRQRVGFSFINPHNDKRVVIYYNNLGMRYSDLKKAFMQNSKSDKLDIPHHLTYQHSRLKKYIPLADEPKKKQIFQNKIFKRIYQFDSSVALTGFYIDEASKEMRAKGTLIQDKGCKLTIARQNNADMQRNVKILLDMAKAKGWDLNSLCIKGSDEFKRTVEIEIKNINNTKLEKLSENKEFNYDKNKLKNTQYQRTRNV